MPQANQVVNYNETTPITTTPVDIFPSQHENKYNMLRIKNDTGEVVEVTFGNNNVYLAIVDENISQPFECSGEVTLSVASGSTTGNFFIQLTRG